MAKRALEKKLCGILDCQKQGMIQSLVFKVSYKADASTTWGTDSKFFDHICNCCKRLKK